MINHAPTGRWIGVMCLGASMVLAGGTLIGCGKSASDSPASDSKAAPDGVDVSGVERAFASAAAPFRFSVDEALRLIKARAYNDALPGLQKLAADPTITPAQRQALQDLVRKLQSLSPAPSR